MKLLTDMSLGNLVQGSTDISALIHLMEHVRHVSMHYLPRVHAKVYISGNELALVTSANFTDGGSFTNIEYGIQIEDRGCIETIRSDIERYANLGGVLSLQRLKDLKNRVTELRAGIREEQRSIVTKMRDAEVLERDAEDQLLRSRIEGRSIHGIFSDTILYLLSSGPKDTLQLHNRIQAIHPDICNDALDRIIDGQHFGKLWKHQVRTAQQDLKRGGLVTYDRARRLWALTSRG